MLETSLQALTREMEEEMGLHVEVGRLLWVVENFFVHEGRQFHELAFYYLMNLPRPCRYDDTDATFTGLDGDTPITFRWFPIDALEELRLFPAFLRSALIDLPASPVHLIHTDA
jgi:ADP-ribose pyrophosphatase YjhB (NUDIX family)